MASFASMQKARYARKQARSRYSSSGSRGVDAAERSAYLTAGFTREQWSQLKTDYPEMAAKILKEQDAGRLTSASGARYSLNEDGSGPLYTNDELYAMRQAEKERVARELSRQLVETAVREDAQKATAKGGYIYIEKRPQRPDADNTKAKMFIGDPAQKQVPFGLDNPAYVRSQPDQAFAVQQVFGFKPVDVKNQEKTTIRAGYRGGATSEPKTWFGRTTQKFLNWWYVVPPGERSVVTTEFATTYAGRYYLTRTNPERQDDPFAIGKVTYTVREKLPGYSRWNMAVYAENRRLSKYPAERIAFNMAQNLEAQGTYNRAGWALREFGTKPATLGVEAVTLYATSRSKYTRAPGSLVLYNWWERSSEYRDERGAAPLPLAARRAVGRARDDSKYSFNIPPFVPVVGDTTFDVPDVLSLGLYTNKKRLKQSVQRELFLTGYRGTELDAFTARGVRLWDTREEASLFPIIAAEDAGNVYGGLGLRSVQKVIPQTTRFGRGVTGFLGVGVGGAGEAGFATYAVEYSRGDVKWRDVAKGAALGFVMAGTFGAVREFPKTTAGRVRADWGTSWIDQPNELFGDQFTKFVGAGRTPMVAALSLTPSPEGARRQTFTQSFTAGSTFSASSTLSSSRSLTATRNFAYTRSPAATRSLTNSFTLAPSRSWSAALTGSQTFAPVGSQTYSQVFTYSLTPAYTDTRVNPGGSFPLLPSGFFGGRRGGRSLRGSKRLLGSTPSLAALELNIRGTGRSPVGGFTGFEIRGLPGLTRRRKSRRKRR